MEPKYGDLVGGGEEGSYKEGKRGKVEGRKWCQKRGTTKLTRRRKSRILRMGNETRKW